MKPAVTMGASIILGAAMAIGQLRAIHAAPAPAEPLRSMVIASSLTAGTVGPDVIVSRQDSIRRYGTIGAITSYAISTTSCNLGDEPAEWFINNAQMGGPVNRHPLIGQNMYRFEDGRFEQIGMSWLKHAFCGVDEFDATNCAVCQPDFDCEFLAVGCSDTYTTGLNGQQSGLGPRSEVNASTGDYPYPFVLGWNVVGDDTGDFLDKRLQVHTADLDDAMHPDARFFMESHYLTTDETGTMRENNASYRECFRGVVVSGGYNLAYDDAFLTVPQKSGVEAWADVDPAVTIVEHVIPGDGRFLIGYLVTDNGDGTWHYEYAIYNQTSDRNAASFSVPLTDCATGGIPGFHDVDYHSGEPYAGTDWPAQIDASSISWTTDFEEDDVNANAIRWNTMYNFRFDADRPPATGNATLGLFKPGADRFTSVPLLVPAARACAADINDDGLVGINDFLQVLQDWGPNVSPADFVGQGSSCPDDLVGVADFLHVLLNWGACPGA